MTLSVHFYTILADKGISQKRVEIHAKNFFGDLVLNIGKGSVWDF
jgi:hypothetical protein